MRYLTFQLNHETFGLDLLQVQEIIGSCPITRVPGVAHYVRGLINLRGRLISVVDLRSRFGMPECEDCGRGCIVVLRVGTRGPRGARGLIVDEVTEVLTLDPMAFEATPELGDGLDTSCVKGLAVIDGQVVRILDPLLVFDSQFTGRDRAA